MINRVYGKEKDIHVAAHQFYSDRLLAKILNKHGVSWKTTATMSKYRSALFATREQHMVSKLTKNQVLVVGAAHAHAFAHLCIN